MIITLLALTLATNSGVELIRECKQARTEEVRQTGNFDKAQENYIRCLDNG